MTNDRSTLSLRIDAPDGSRFGPGKAALLRAIEAHGSISGGARALAMSYPRALRLVDQMNGQFGAPLVETFHGGATRGGAALTQLGHDVAAAYEAVRKRAEAATAAERAALMALIHRN
ncbi:MAG: LysR family transcriptional regulator [Pseudomonadota bacterium]